MSLLVAAQSGDRRVLLERLRDELASAVDAGPDPRDLAGLAVQLRLVTAELEGLREPTGKKKSVEDALAARRAAKQASSG